MKYYLIAGEPSGDLHGSNLMKSIRALDSDAQFQFWGGDHMLAIDSGIITHIKETSIMGFLEVIRNIRKIYSFFRKAKSSIKAFRPDVVVFIDYPGFNLRMAKWAKNQGFLTAYYISPQLWAWKKGRSTLIKRYIDEMIVILPFEKAFYQNLGIDVHFSGHPLLPVVKQYKSEVQKNGKETSSERVLALLPGSRVQEIKKMLPEMISAADKMGVPYKVVVGKAPSVKEEVYQQIMERLTVSCTVEYAATYDLLSEAHLAMVTSGTATLETALFKVPQVVCYKTGFLNYELGKRLVDLKYISLVNLILDEEAVPELIQGDVHPENIVKSLERVESNRSIILQKYDALEQLLTTQVNPHLDAARHIVELAQRSK